MQIVNITRQTELCTQAEHAASFLRRLRGLMFRRNLPRGAGLLLEPEWSIHTFFMRFPIDVLFLNRSHIVLAAHQSVPPNRLGPVHRGAHAVLELPAGSIAETNTHAGDQLDIRR